MPKRAEIQLFECPRKRDLFEPAIGEAVKSYVLESLGQPNALQLRAASERAAPQPL